MRGTRGGGGGRAAKDAQRQVVGLVLAPGPSDVDEGKDGVGDRDAVRLAHGQDLLGDVGREDAGGDKRLALGARVGRRTVERLAALSKPRSARTREGRGGRERERERGVRRGVSDARQRTKGFGG